LAPSAEDVDAAKCGYEIFVSEIFLDLVKDLIKEPSELTE